MRIWKAKKKQKLAQTRKSQARRTRHATQTKHGLNKALQSKLSALPRGHFRESACPRQSDMHMSAIDTFHCFSLLCKHTSPAWLCANRAQVSKAPPHFAPQPCQQHTLKAMVDQVCKWPLGSRKQHAPTFQALPNRNDLKQREFNNALLSGPEPE